MVRNARLILAFILGLIIGAGGQTLLFMERQCSKIEAVLREDFKILLFLKGELNPNKRKVLEEKLLALPDVEEVRYVSSHEALLALRREDPELVESIVLVGENPLQPAYEIRLGSRGLERIPQWVFHAQTLEDWADIRYKPAQVQAILQAQFYSHFLNLILSAIISLMALLAFVELVLAACRLQSGIVFSFAESIVCVMGALCGIGLASLAALPLRLFSSWGGWPPVSRQAVVVMGAAVAGWVLCKGRD